MLFHSIEFFIFFGALLLLRYILPKNMEKLILLAASYFFYGWWSLKFIFLLLISTLVDYYSAKAIQKTPKKKPARKTWLIFSLAANLGVLFIFKYWVWANSLIGNDLAYTLILPLGISFYTFQSMSYTIDVYRGDAKVEKSLLSFALYVSFFPQLVAGPIERASTLLKQINRGPKYIKNYATIGISIFVWGMIKKTIFADNLGNYVDEIYAVHNDATSLDLMLATYAFALQIYCDFSGYTDMARGTARLLGYDLNKNFDLPYFATNIREFWHKWHITLSTWFRDYVYISLGGNKGNMAFNILITFLLAGLWHGANLTFVFWGGLHGLMLILYHYFDKKTNSKHWLKSKTTLAKTLKILFTLDFVCFSWIFFRSESLGQAFEIIGNIMQFNFNVLSWEYAFTLMIIFTALMVLRKYFDIENVLCKDRFTNWSAIWLGIFAIIVFGAVEKTDFIYFQF